MPRTMPRPLCRRVLLIACLLPPFSALGAAPSLCEEGSVEFPEIQLQEVMSGLDDPVGLVHAGDGSGRLFVVEQEGVLRAWKDGAPLKQAFLDIRDRVTAGGELGLLGVAFHPQFATNGRLFVNYTTKKNGLRTVIAEFSAKDKNANADPNSERTLITVEQPYSNHNGGQLAFGPDGFLYIALGDGGAGNDPHDNGQNLASHLGKILRIDVDTTRGRRGYGIPADNPFVKNTQAEPEIWAYGLRNPWRFSFDRQTGWLYVADVGQGAREEIDVIETGGNYGWNIMEGKICTPGVDPSCDSAGLRLPILDYPRSQGTSVTGGYVYRGAAIPGLCGAYLYADYNSGNVFGLRYDGKTVTARATLLETGHRISSLGEDEQGELYIVDHGGEVLKVTTAQ